MKNFRRKYIGLAALALVQLPAESFAEPGLFEINQACVEVGCFAGDSPGFPITITKEGVYFLSSNILAPTFDTTTITIAVDNVVVDLRGFSIKGPNICSGEPGDCTFTERKGGGIAAGSVRNTTVKNGNVGGFGFAGVNLGEASKVENVHASHNRRVGIWTRAGSIISDSVATLNGDLGMETGQTKILNSTAIENGSVGMAVGDGTLVQSATIRGSEVGILDWHGSFIQDSSIMNTSTGLESINGGTRVENTHFVDNEGFAIFHRGAALFVEGGVPVQISNSTFYNNGGSMVGQNFGGGGVILETGPNMCGTNLGCGL